MTARKIYTYAYTLACWIVACSWLLAVLDYGWDSSAARLLGVGTIVMTLIERLLAHMWRHIDATEKRLAAISWKLREADARRVLTQATRSTPVISPIEPETAVMHLDTDVYSAAQAVRDRARTHEEQLRAGTATPPQGSTPQPGSGQRSPLYRAEEQRRLGNLLGRGSDKPPYGWGVGPKVEANVPYWPYWNDSISS